MTIASSRLMQIKHMMCFLTCTEKVDVNNNLICLIWIIFEKLMAISMFVAKFFPVVSGMYCSTLIVKIAMVRMQRTKMTGCFIIHCLGLRINV